MKNGPKNVIVILFVLYIFFLHKIIIIRHIYVYYYLIQIYLEFWNNMYMKLSIICALFTFVILFYFRSVDHLIHFQVQYSAFVKGRILLVSFWYSSVCLKFKFVYDDVMCNSCFIFIYLYPNYTRKKFFHYNSSE